MLRILQERLQTTRFAYGLSINDMAVFCNADKQCTISKSAVSAWEKGLRTPSIEAMHCIASSFGVSLDWFTGTSDEPYTDMTIEAVENLHPVPLSALTQALEFYNASFIPYLKPYMKNTNIEDFLNHVSADSITEQYLDKEKRRKNYSLGARANIIVLQQFIHVFLPSDSLRASEHEHKKNILRQLAKTLISAEETINIRKDPPFYMALPDN